MLYETFCIVFTWVLASFQNDQLILRKDSSQLDAQNYLVLSKIQYNLFDGGKWSIPFTYWICFVQV